MDLAQVKQLEYRALFECGEVTALDLAQLLWTGHIDTVVGEKSSTLDLPHRRVRYWMKSGALELLYRSTPISCPLKNTQAMLRTTNVVKVPDTQNSEAWKSFYKAVEDSLNKLCEIDPDPIMVTLSYNPDSNILTAVV